MRWVVIKLVRRFMRIYWYYFMKKLYDFILGEKGNFEISKGNKSG